VIRTSKEVRGFVENVEEHERINKDGVVIEQKPHKFNNVAEIQETLPGILNMDEYRDGSPGAKRFPWRAFSRGNDVVGVDLSSLSCERIRDHLGGHGELARPGSMESALRAKNGPASPNEYVVRGRRDLPKLSERDGVD